VETRPEPTIYGNCDSWDFIVGKTARRQSPQNTVGRSLLLCNKNFIHMLFTGSQVDP
jgi:hypothetical protein